MERRHFFRNLAAGGSLLLTAPVLFSSCSNDNDNGGNNNNNTGVTVDLTSSEFATLQVVGGFAYKNDIIIIRTSDTAYIALSKLCTHSQCTVSYNSSAGVIPCPCHGSIFSKDGAVLNGPAASPLKKYDVKINGNTLTIS